MAYAESETAGSIRTELGAVIRRRREEAERSLNELASAADVSTAYLSEVERGLKDISTDKLAAVARALELPIGDLYLELAQRRRLVMGCKDGALRTAAKQAGVSLWA